MPCERGGVRASVNGTTLPQHETDDFISYLIDSLATLLGEPGHGAATTDIAQKDNDDLTKNEWPRKGGRCLEQFVTSETIGGNWKNLK